MLWKCYTQYASHFGKLSNGHRMGKGQFSFQSQREAMPKNAQITTPLHSSHTWAKYCLKFSKPGFNSTWTMNFQMFKLYLEKAEEQRSNCQLLLGHWKSKRVPEKHPLLLLWLHQSLWLCESQQMWKILQEISIPDHLICLLRKLYAGQEATVRTGHRTTDWFQIRKGVHQGFIFSPCLFNLYAEYIMWNAGLDEAQAGIKISRRNIYNLIYIDDTTLKAESKKELKCLLMKVKEESEKVGLNSTFRKLSSWHLVPSLYGK